MGGHATFYIIDVKSNFTAPFEADDEGFNSFISQINDSLASLGFEVKRWREESEVGLTWFSLVSCAAIILTSDLITNRQPSTNERVLSIQVNVEGNFDRPELGQQVSDLSPLEINYYREIVSHPCSDQNRIRALTPLVFFPDIIHHQLLPRQLY